MPGKQSSGTSPTIEDFAVYQRQLALFSESSTEKGIELLKIGTILATLPERQSFPDIGAGGYRIRQDDILLAVRKAG